MAEAYKSKELECKLKDRSTIIKQNIRGSQSQTIISFPSANSEVPRRAFVSVAMHKNPFLYNLLA
jgi:hypothetical protein